MRYENGMRYDALTIDSQTVFHSGFRFESGLLAQLQQFKDGQTRFVLSRVVVRELLKHLTIKTEEAHQALLSSLKKAKEYGLAAEEPELGGIDPTTTARARLEAFIAETGATIVDYDAVAITEIMDRYFKATPPFASSGKKKNEFPDAVALLSLEAWAAANDKQILAATNDADWAAFAKASQHIDVVDDLADALAMLQSGIDEADKIISDLLQEIDREGSALRGEFERLLDQATPGYVAYAEAESYHHVEPDQVDLVYKGFRFNGEPGDRAFEVVQARKDYLVAQVEITVLVRAEGTFTFSIWDSIDKEYVSLGASQAHTDAELEAFVLISFERDGGGPWEIVDVELLQDWDTIDFGYIEPDYSREWEA